MKCCRNVVDIHEWARMRDASCKNHYTGTGWPKPEWNWKLNRDRCVPVVGVATRMFKMAASGSRGRWWRHRSDAGRSCTVRRRRPPYLVASSRRRVWQVSHETHLSRPSPATAPCSLCSCRHSKPACFPLLSLTLFAQNSSKWGQWVRESTQGWLTDKF